MLQNATAFSLLSLRYLLSFHPSVPIVPKVSPMVLNLLSNVFLHRVDSNMADLSEPMATDPAKYYEELFVRLDALKRKETFCDVTVAVKGKEFKAHKVVLAAASPFFLSLWESNMIESNAQLIEIKLEEATASVMEDVLEYIYTGNVSVTEESCHNLIATANYLLLPGLKTLAGVFLKGNLTVENCVFNYYFADRYYCEELKRACCSEICENFTAVMETGDFLNLDLKQVMEWVSNDDIRVNAEEEVFERIVKWVSYNRSERESCFLDLLRHVRLNCVSQNFLQKRLVKEELITSNCACLNFVMQSIVGTDEGLSKAPRNCLKAQVEGIFVCGGSKAMCYLPHVNMWYEMTNMSFRHQNHAAIQYKDKVYVFSKREDVDDQFRVHVVEYYTPSTNFWGSIQTDFGIEDHFSSVSVLNGCSSLYALTNDEIAPENSIFVYDPNKNFWHLQGGDESRSRWGACGVAHGHHLYIIGGTDDRNATATGITKVERFDPNDESLEEVAPLNEARHAAFGAAMNNKIYVAGGIQVRGLRRRLLSTCEEYDPVANEWHLMVSLCVPRHSASMVCFKGALYVVGGLKSTSVPSTDRELSVETFDSETNEWKEKTAIPISNESGEERNEQIHYKACAASVHQDVLKRPIEL